MKVVARAVPLILITVEGTKPVPVKLTTADAVPANALVGDIAVTVGAGLSTSRLAALEDALLTDPFETTTGISAPFASCVAGTIAVSWVGLTYVVASDVPPT